MIKENKVEHCKEQDLMIDNLVIPVLERDDVIINNEKIEKYIPSRVKESGNVEEFIIQCVQDYIRRERIQQERNSR